jgi:hypothetical protein
MSLNHDALFLRREIVMKKILGFIAIVVLPTVLVVGFVLWYRHNRLQHQQEEVVHRQQGIAKAIRKLAAEMEGGVLEQRGFERFKSDWEREGTKGVTITVPPFDCREVLRRYRDCADLVDTGYDIKRCFDIVHKELRGPDEIFCNLVFAESLSHDSQ